MGVYNSPIGCCAIRLRQGALPAIIGFVFYLGLVFEQSQGIAKVRSAGTSSNATKTMQDGFVGSRSCVPCHKNIYDKFAETSMGRSMTRVTPELLANLVTSGSSYDEKLNQHFEVFAREGKLFQSQYAMEVGGTRFSVRLMKSNGLSGRVTMVSQE